MATRAHGVRILIAALAAAAAGGCARSPASRTAGAQLEAGPAVEAEAKVVRVDEAADGREIQLRPGEELEIALSETPGTGYRWTVTSDGAPVCRLERDRYDPGPPRPGAPGRRTFACSAARAGRAEVELVYRRSWSGETAGRFTVRVVVR